MPPVKSAHAPTTGSRSGRDSFAELKFRVNKAFKTMKKKKAADGTSASTSIPPLSTPSLSLSSECTVKTEYFGEREEIEWRDANETRHVDDEMEIMREIEDTDASPELLHVQSIEAMKKADGASTSESTSIPPLSPSISLVTAPAPDFTNNLPAIFCRSNSTATASLWQSLASNESKISANSTAYLSTDSTTSTSDDFFSLDCPVDMSLTYSGSMQGLEVMPRDTMLSTYNELFEDPVVTVKDNHAKLGCLVAMKDLTDDITLTARDVRDFYNSPRKSVTFTHFSPQKCGCGVETRGLMQIEEDGHSRKSLEK